MSPRVAIGRRRAVAGAASEPAAETSDEDRLAAERRFLRFRRRLGYGLLAASALCLCAAAWLMHSPATALLPASAALGMAGWDAARG